MTKICDKNVRQIQGTKQNKGAQNSSQSFKFYQQKVDEGKQTSNLKLMQSMLPH